MIIFRRLEQSQVLQLFACEVFIDCLYMPCVQINILFLLAECVFYQIFTAEMINREIRLFKVVLCFFVSLV